MVPEVRIILKMLDLMSKCDISQLGLARPESYWAIVLTNPTHTGVFKSMPAVNTC